MVVSNRIQSAGPGYANAAVEGMASSAINQAGQKDVARIQGRTAEHVAAMQAGASQGQNKSSENIAAMQAASQREVMNATMLNNDKARDFNMRMQQDSQENNKIIAQLDRDAQDARDNKNWDRADKIAAEERKYETTENLKERLNKIMMFNAMLKLSKHAQKQEGDTNKAYRTAVKVSNNIKTRNTATIATMESIRRSMIPLFREVVSTLKAGSGEGEPIQMDAVRENKNNLMREQLNKLTEGRLDYDRIRNDPNMVVGMLKSGEITPGDVSSLFMLNKIVADEMEIIYNTSYSKLPEGVTPGQEYEGPISSKAGQERSFLQRTMLKASGRTGDEYMKYPSNYREAGYSSSDSPETRASMQAFGASALGKEASDLNTQLRTIYRAFGSSNDPALQAAFNRSLGIIDVSADKVENRLGAIMDAAIDPDARTYDYDVISKMLAGMFGGLHQEAIANGDTELAKQMKEITGSDFKLLTDDEYELLPTE